MKSQLAGEINIFDGPLVCPGFLFRVWFFGTTVMVCEVV